MAAATFFTDYENIQIPVIDQITPQFRNAAEAEMQGVEIEVTAIPTKKLQLHAGVGYLDAEYRKLDAQSLQNRIIPVTLDSKFPNAPKWSFNLGLSYSTNLANFGQLILRGNYAWRDKMFKDAINTEEVVQDSFGILYAAAMFETNARIINYESTHCRCRYRRFDRGPQSGKDWH